MGSEMQVMDPRQANFQETVNLVERNTAPGGYQLVCPEESGKIRSQFDLVELAGEIQTADKFTRATAGSKLSVIAEQVRYLQTCKNYMSMISPEEWGKDCPEFVASYKLEHDHTWTPMADVEAKEDENAIIDKILKNKSQLAIGFK